MDRSVEVVVSELRLAAARLQDAGQRLQDGLSSVDLQTRELLGSGWKGEAASAFGQEWEKWHSGAGQVVRGLQTMSDLLTVAGKEYAKTDEQAAGAVGSSFQGTGGSHGDAAGNSPGSAATGGSPGGTGGANDMAQLMNLTQPVSQVGGQVAQGLTQAGQLAAGLAQAAAGMAQQAEHVQQASDAKNDEDKGDDDGPGEAAASGDPSAPTAPVDSSKPTGGSRQSAE